MKIKDIYKSALEQGIINDPRGREGVEKSLARLQENYQGIPENERKYYDQEKLQSPYSDTRILYGNPEQEVNSVLVGIDVEVGEVLLADRLRERGRKVDLVIAHHPEGRAQAAFYEVMHMQADILNRLGVPINVAEGILEERVREVSRRVMPANHQRAVDVARLLDIPFMCLHTPADNSVTHYLQTLMDERKPETVREVLDLVLGIPEYIQAAQNNNPPTVLVGHKGNRCGKIFVDMTGGTGGSKEAFEKLTHTDIGTIVGMHIGEDHRKEAEKNHINVVIAGHMASDSLGLNLLLDYILRQGALEIIPCSGFLRVERPGKA